MNNRIIRIDNARDKAKLYNVSLHDVKRITYDVWLAQIPYSGSYHTTDFCQYFHHCHNQLRLSHQGWKCLAHSFASRKLERLEILTAMWYCSNNKNTSKCNILRCMSCFIICIFYLLGLVTKKLVVFLNKVVYKDSIYYTFEILISLWLRPTWKFITFSFVISQLSLRNGKTNNDKKITNEFFSFP